MVSWTTAVCQPVRLHGAVFWCVLVRASGVIVQSNSQPHSSWSLITLSFKQTHCHKKFKKGGPHQRSIFTTPESCWVNVTYNVKAAWSLSALLQILNAQHWLHFESLSRILLAIVFLLSTLYIPRGASWANGAKKMEQKDPICYFAIWERIAYYCVLLSHVKRMPRVWQILFLSAEVEQRPNDEAMMPLRW